MIYKQIPLANMPINLILLPQAAEVVFVVVQPFKLIYDMGTDGQDAYFDQEGFSIGGSSYYYDTQYRYKEIPAMLKWLQEQKLTM